MKNLEIKRIERKDLEFILKHKRERIEFLWKKRNLIFTNINIGDKTWTEDELLECESEILKLQDEIEEVQTIYDKLNIEIFKWSE